MRIVLEIEIERDGGEDDPRDRQFRGSEVGEIAEALDEFIGDDDGELVDAIGCWLTDLEASTAIRAKLRRIRARIDR